MSEPTQESFLKDVAQHRMIIVRNDGIHRHIIFAKPGTYCQRFELITWPGFLCYAGDMGTFVFRRLEDMFSFFRDERTNDGKLRINLGYWAAASEFEHEGFRFNDLWDHNYREYTYRFIWCCYALAWGIKQYDKSLTTITSDRLGRAPSHGC